MHVRKDLFVGGRWVPPASGASLDVVSPATEEVVGRVPDTTVADLDAAVGAARAALAGPWSAMSFDERAAVVERAAEHLAARADEIAEAITLEQGTPVRMARFGLAPAAARMMASAVDCARQIPLRTVRRDGTGAVLVQEDPVGVVAAMVPFNGPLPIAVLKAAPALLAGCPVVLKPSPYAPMAVFFLADALAEAGLPAGMLSVITGGAEVGETMVAHAGVDMVSFTGSTAVGRRIAATAGDGLKKVSLELGGKSAGIVLDDADLGRAAATIGGVFATAGQYCRALTRVLAPRSRYDEVVGALAAVAARMTPGDPNDEATTMAPLISAAQRDRVEGYVRSARDEGARLVCGGGRPAGLDRGFWFEPTIFTDATNGMRFVREEIFGPVLAILPYDGDDEAVAIANDNDYGLSGAVFTADLQRGLDVALRVETGTIGVNQHGARSCAPCGGVKASGIGQEHGPEGFREFLSPKAVMIPEALAAQLEAGGVPTVPPIR
ncbi:MAG TPA: aldehyde dehydrogenase family protein [Acidimicrobiales bacterium]|nr:aldehyde dehydrogenase family protein [Acidimicrobiales bacterium]